jgi:hypothetical protein
MRNMKTGISLIALASFILLVLTGYKGNDAMRKMIEEDTTAANIILVGIGHPFHTHDDITLPRIADSLKNKSPYFSKVYTFRNGNEFLEVLKKVTKQYGKIGNLSVMGHSGYQGYFVEANSGFHRDEYQVLQQGTVIPFTKNVSKMSLFRKALKEKEIIFSAASMIVLIGCNTAYGEDNIAFDLSDATNLPVIGSNQKIDLYNVKNQGEEMKGLEDRTFYAYIPDGQEMIRYDLCRKSITVSTAIEVVRERISKLNEIQSSLRN